MNEANLWKLNPADRAVLRDLALRKMEIAFDPLNLERKQLWLELHSGRGSRPLVLAEWGGVLDESRPFAPVLKCTEEWAQNVERELSQDLWVFNELQDDHVVEPWYNAPWFVEQSNYGVEAVVHKVKGDHLTARSWDAPIIDISRDFHRLHPRTYSVDRAKSEAWKNHLGEVFAGILPVRTRGGFWWTMGMTIVAIDLIGLEKLMLFMYDDPAGLHQLMKFLMEDHLAFAKWLEREGLLSLNNENDYVGSGSQGYTRELPAPESKAGMPVQTRDQWVLLESQETVGVGPEQFEEFVFPYQQQIAEQYGLVYYGCCEPVHTRWEVLKKLKNLKAVSVAPLCNQEIMAEALGGDYIFSRKPNPTLISTPHFNEELIRQDFRATLAVTRKQGCRVELIMKDVHTLNNEPRRLARWVELAREEIAKAW